MAVKVSREAHFGAGSKGFHFELREDDALDRETYENGRRLEAARFQEGSIAQQIFDRLSANGKVTAPDETACLPS